MATVPLVSLVVPCFNVERFLTGFLASLDQQIVDPSLFEVIFVVDGSPDDSEKHLREWAASTDCNATLIVTENRGVSSARNTGIEAAVGQWVSFPDPDDLLGEGYLNQVLAAIEQDPGESLLATRLVRIDESGKTSLGHALDYRYREGSRTLDLKEEPSFLQLAVHTALFRNEVLVAQGIRFDPRIKVFEDGKFVAEYMLAAPNTQVRVLCEAHYLYQVRDDGSGALSSSDADPTSRYLTTTRAGHLELLRGFPGSAGPPLWLQFMVLYDLYWLFAASMRMKDPIHGASSESLIELNVLVREVLRSCTEVALWQFNVVTVAPEIRGAWIVAHSGFLPMRWVRRYREDADAREAEIRYLSASTECAEIVHVGAEAVLPSFSKWRAVRFLGEDWLFERILWLPESESLRLSAAPGSEEDFACEGQVKSDAQFDKIFGWGRPEMPEPAAARLTSGGLVGKHEKRTSSPSLPRRVLSWLANRVAVMPPISLRYRNAWLLMDRDTQANDNAEALARYLTRRQTTVRVFFVIRKESSEYARLRAAGLPVLPFGGVRHFLLVRNASHIVSSHIDEYVVRPFRELGVTKTWNFVFLQHGVTQNDLSRWFNSKDVQLFMTATEAERNAFVADGTPYILTEKEVRLTGFPRHDRLVEAMREESGLRTRRSVLIMPTWRSYLLTETLGTGNSRGAGDKFAQSGYVEQWSGLLRDSTLKSFAKAHDLDLVLLPHPNLEPHLDYLEVPEWVRIESYREGAIAGLLAEAQVVVTDYSSQSFEGAFCRVPCVYFQFDREEFFGGGHIGSTGYFDVESDGFGPVVGTKEAAVLSIRELVEGTSPMTAVYRERIEDLYPARDGRASERVYEAISALPDRD